jgi:hypothetical protein
MLVFVRNYAEVFKEIFALKCVCDKMLKAYDGIRLRLRRR